MCVGYFSWNRGAFRNACNTPGVIELPNAKSGVGVSFGPEASRAQGGTYT